MKKEKCVKCNHEWYRRIPEKPVLCPSCKSKYWQEPKKEKHLVS